MYIIFNGDTPIDFDRALIEANKKLLTVSPETKPVLVTGEGCFSRGDHFVVTETAAKIIVLKEMADQWRWIYRYPYKPKGRYKDCSKRWKHACIVCQYLKVVGNDCTHCLLRWSSLNDHEKPCLASDSLYNRYFRCFLNCDLEGIKEHAKEIVKLSEEAQISVRALGTGCID